MAGLNGTNNSARVETSRPEDKGLFIGQSICRTLHHADFMMDCVLFSISRKVLYCSNTPITLLNILILTTWKDMIILENRGLASVLQVQTHNRITKCAGMRQVFFFCGREKKLQHASAYCVCVQMLARARAARNCSNDIITHVTLSASDVRKYKYAEVLQYFM